MRRNLLKFVFHLGLVHKSIWEPLNKEGKERKERKSLSEEVIARKLKLNQVILAINLIEILGHSRCPYIFLDKLLTFIGTSAR